MADFSVVVVTYNSASTIDACLMSALATMGPDDELFVVDNASVDDTVERIRRWADQDPRLKAHFSDVNLGFSAGCNVGLRLASGKHQVLLNPDTFVTPGWLKRMRAHFVDEKVGAVGPVATYSLQNQLASTYFPVDEIVGHPIEDVAAKIADANAGQGVQTKLLIGFCVMLPRSVIDHVGLLDPELFLGMDDLDLSWRLGLAGYRLIIATDTYIVHEGQVSFKTRPKTETQALVQESTDVLARKLQNYYGEGRVPGIDALWGAIPWFKPSFDLWGPRSTTFRVSFDGPWKEALGAFLGAFESREGVGLEVFVDDDRLAAARQEVAVRVAEGRRDPSPAPEVTVVAGSSEPPPERNTVHLEPGSCQPWHLPAISPELMRQAAGLRTAHRTQGLTSIVILTLNELRYTKECLSSLYEFTPEPFELIVVDNSSTDSTRSFLKDFAERHDNVTLVFNDENLGFAGGCNQGLALAGGEFLLLLNNDVVVTEGWLTRMRRPLELDPQIGIVGPRSNSVSGSQILPDATYTTVGNLHAYGRRRARMHAGQGWFAPMVVGFAMLMPAKLVEAIGGLDTRFGRGNFEDDDFCYRAQLAGWKIWVADDVFIHHYGSRTFLGQNIDYTALIDRNKVVFREKWNLDRPFETRPELDAMIGALFGKVGPELLIVPLPDPAAVPLVVENIAIEGIKRSNLLLDADWTGPPSAWLPVVEAFTVAFCSGDPVTLVVAGATDEAIERISAILEPRGADAPDVLIVEECYRGAFGLLKICQGVVAGHVGRQEETRHMARLLGRPVLAGDDPLALRIWAGLLPDTGAIGPRESARPL